MAEGENNVLSAEAVKQLRQALQVVKPDGRQPQIPQLSQPPRELPIRPPLLINTESEAVPAWACCAVIDTQTINGETRIKVAKPSSTFYPVYIFNGPNIIGAAGSDDTKVGQLGETEKVLYDSGSPVAGDRFGPKPGQWQLSANYPQVAIVEGVFDTANRILLAKRIPITGFAGFANEDGANGETVSINVASGVPGLLIGITDMDVDCVNSGADITEGDEVRAGDTNCNYECFKICTGTGGDSTITVNLTGEVTGTGTS